MIISLIVAMDRQQGIGKENRLPWRLSADMKRFKALTMGHHLIMGRKTYESIGRPLPGRTTIVVSRNPGYAIPNCPETDCLVAQSLPVALSLAMERGENEAFIIGGSEIFAQALDMAERIYLTQVHADTGADVFFPPFDRDNWVEIESTDFPADEKNQYPATFTVMARKKVPGKT